MSKKIISTFLCVMMAFCFVACSNNSTAENHKEQETNITIISSQEKDTSDSADKKSEANNSRVLVAYFSRAGENYGVGNIEKGNTEIVAEMIADKTGADIFKIERATPYPTDYDECVEEAKNEQNDNARPNLKNTLDNLDDYDVIYIGTPIWHGDMPMPVYTFIESVEWDGKTIYPFATHAGSGLSSVPQTLIKFCGGATIKDGLAIAGTDAQNNQEKVKEDVSEWIESNKEQN